VPLAQPGLPTSPGAKESTAKANEVKKRPAKTAGNTVELNRMMEPRDKVQESKRVSSEPTTI
jgi:hypothetical protein